MNKRLIPPEADINRLVGHRFPGGTYTVAHWENFLLSECTGADLLPAAQVHPIALFHLPIMGANTSIAEMFELGQAESDLSIMIENYDWEIFLPLQEDTQYRVTGAITDAQRCTSPEGNVYDRIVFCFEVHTPGGERAARTAITWHYTRGML